MMADDADQDRYQSWPRIGSWEHVSPCSHRDTPTQEYRGFNLSSLQLSREPGTLSNDMQLLPSLPQLEVQPMPRWPSMLYIGSPSTFQPVFPEPIQPIQPVTIGVLQTPTSQAPSRPAAIPRKTLSDLDRESICQYAKEHPDAKQTEIGLIFGVERSAVSKVLRRENKRPLQDDGRPSIPKRRSGRTPNFEEALATWAKKQEKEKLPLTDDIICDMARKFASRTTAPQRQEFLTASWIETFKLENKLDSVRSRKSSLAPDAEGDSSSAASSSQTPFGTSPKFSQGVTLSSPIDLRGAKRYKSTRNKNPDRDLSCTRAGRPCPLRRSAFSDDIFTGTAPSLFLSEPLPSISPYATTNSGIAPSLVIPVGLSRARRNLPAPPSEGATPKYACSSVLDSHIEQRSDPITGTDETVRLAERPNTLSPSDEVRPPPLPTRTIAVEQTREITPSTSNSALGAAISAEEALEALGIFHDFIEQQAAGFLDFQEGVTVGKLTEKLRMQSRVDTNAL